MIRLTNLAKRYGNFWAVDHVSLEVQKGEIFGFLGVNGAGKTTTIRMMVGVLQSTSGSIELGGYDLQEYPTRAKSITGYIPDRPFLYNKLTGREFMHFIAELYLVPAKETGERIESLLEEFGLKDWGNDLIEGYSHGMKQRLATCAALIHKPKILIIDEPMVGLDPRGAKLLKDSLRRYAQLGTTIFLSTHSLNVAEELCDRLAIIEKGKLLTVGTLNEIKGAIGGFEGGLESLFLRLTSEMSKPDQINGSTE